MADDEVVHVVIDAPSPASGEARMRRSGSSQAIFVDGSVTGTGGRPMLMRSMSNSSLASSSCSMPPPARPPTPRPGGPTVNHHLPGDLTSFHVDPFNESKSPLVGQVAEHPTVSFPQEPVTITANGSIATSAYTIAATALGAGTLGMPYAFANLGVVLGPLAMIMFLCLSVYSLHLMVCIADAAGVKVAADLNHELQVSADTLNAEREAAHQQHQRHMGIESPTELPDEEKVTPVLHDPLPPATYEALAEHYGGVWFRRCVGFFMVLVSWGLTVLYVAVIQQLLTPVATLLANGTSYPAGTWGVRLLVFLFWLFLMLPLSLLRTITMLKHASAVSLFSASLLAIAAIIHLARVGATQDSIIGPTDFFKAVQGMNNMKAGFGAQTAVMTVYQELGSRSPPKILKAVLISTSSCALFYVLVGLVGAFNFGPNVGDNLLAQYPDPMETWYVVVAFAGMAVTITLSFPVCMFPPRDTILQIFGYQSSQDAPTGVRLLVGTLMSVCSLVLGIFLPSLNLAFGIMGGVFGNMLSYVFPAILALKSDWLWEKEGATQTKPQATTHEPAAPQEGVAGTVDDGALLRTRHLAASLLLLVVGLLIGPLGTAVSLYLEFSPDSGAVIVIPRGGNSTANATLLARAALTAPFL